MSHPESQPGGEPADTGQALCLACGLCCRGVWFTHATLAPDELGRAREVGLTVVQRDGQFIFHQPCVLHTGGKCSAYDKWRPAACAKYRCALLAKHESGAIGFDEAMAHVEAARAMADRAFAEVGNLEGGLGGPALIARLNADPATASAGAAPLSASTRLDVVALSFYYRKHFERADPQDAPEDPGFG